MSKASRTGPVHNDPTVLAELTEACEAYERAFVAGDVQTLNRFFWDSETAVRFGLDESLWGHAQIADFRRGAPTAVHARERTRVEVNTFGRDFGTYAAEDARRASCRTGRVLQSWVRQPEGWRIVAAHVSVVDASRKAPN